jgi:hypothetical protein
MVEHLHDCGVGRVSVLAVKCLGDAPKRSTAAIIACIRDDGAQKILPDMFRDMFQDILPLEFFKQTICKMKMGVFFGHSLYRSFIRVP